MLKSETTSGTSAFSVQPLALSSLLAPFYAALATPKFRGEIWENNAGVPMARGYNNANAPFDINSAAYLRPVFRAIRNRDIRKVVICAAVQCLKTFTIEESLSYFLEHDPGDTAAYDCDLEAARDHSRTRLIPRLRAISGLGGSINEAESNNRFDVTTSIILLPSATLRLWPLNESSVQRITLRYVFISDAFLSKKTGLIPQAIARTTQHASDKKIIIESQGSESGDDFDAQWCDTNMQTLHVVCPDCGMGQPFEWERYRGDDFVAASGKPRTLNAEAAAAVATSASGIQGSTVQSSKFNGSDSESPALIRVNPVEVKTPIPGTYSGMQRGCPHLSNDALDEPGILASTYYECYHCGAHWNDVPDVRQALDDSSYYVASNPNPNALPENVGFSWPAWINQRLRWGDIMLDYLKAKRADDSFGNRTPLIQWYQKRAGRIWQDDLAQAPVRISGGLDYDPASTWEKEWRRIGIVDVQLHASHFWVSFDAIARDGESRQLWFGCMTSFDQIEKKQIELKVQPNRMFIDYGHESDLVKKECLRRGVWHPGDGRRRGFWLGWNMLSSSRWDKFKRCTTHKDGSKTYHFDIVSDGEKYSEMIGDQRREVFRFNFSALHCGDMFRRHRDGDGAPKSHFLLEGVGAEKNELSHVAQIFSRYRAVAIDPKTGLKKPMWKPKRQNIHDHAFTIGQMKMCVYRVWNLGGRVEAEVSTSASA